MRLHHLLQQAHQVVPALAVRRQDEGPRRPRRSSVAVASRLAIGARQEVQEGALYVAGCQVERLCGAERGVAWHGVAGAYRVRVRVREAGGRWR